jgi:hypothetical protein
MSRPPATRAHLERRGPAAVGPAARHGAIKYNWVLPVCRYEGLEPLLATLAERIVAPAEAKVKALEERRRMIDPELTKPR